MTKHLLAALALIVALTSGSLTQIKPGGVRVDGPVMASQVLTKVPPVYPPLARQAQIQGSVILKVRISKSGDVVSIWLISGHPMLAPAAMEAVKQWKYKPYLLNGDPVDVETNVTVNFTLSDKPPAEGVVGSVPGGLPEEEKVGIVSNGEGATHSAYPQRVRVSSGVMQVLLLTKVHPQYPQEAKDQRIQGVVVLKVIIDKEGNVAKIELISGHPALAPAAIDAVKQWKYKPYLLNQTPVEVDTQVQVNFTLAY